MVPRKGWCCRLCPVKKPLGFQTELEHLPNNLASQISGPITGALKGPASQRDVRWKTHFSVEGGAQGEFSLNIVSQG